MTFCEIGNKIEIHLKITLKSFKPIVPLPRYSIITSGAQTLQAGGRLGKSA